MEAKSQSAVEMYGLPGLMVPDAQPFNTLLGAAPAGRPGAKLQRACDVAILPGIPAQLARGQSQPVGWLLWAGPARPLPIMPIAFEVLRRISLSVDEISNELGVDKDQVEQIVQEMVSIGAATMIEQVE